MRVSYISVMAKPFLVIETVDCRSSTLRNRIAIECRDRNLPFSAALRLSFRVLENHKRSRIDVFITDFCRRLTRAGTTMKQRVNQQAYRTYCFSTVFDFS